MTYRSYPLFETDCKNRTEFVGIRIRDESSTGFSDYFIHGKPQGKCFEINSWVVTEKYRNYSARVILVKDFFSGRSDPENFYLKIPESKFVNYFYYNKTMQKYQRYILFANSFNHDSLSMIETKELEKGYDFSNCEIFYEWEVVLKRKQKNV